MQGEVKTAHNPRTIERAELQSLNPHHVTWKVPPSCCRAKGLSWHPGNVSIQHLAEVTPGLGLWFDDKIIAVHADGFVIKDVVQITCSDDGGVTRARPGVVAVGTVSVAGCTVLLHAPVPSRCCSLRLDCPSPPSPSDGQLLSSSTSHSMHPFELQGNSMCPRLCAYPRCMFVTVLWTP